MNIPGTLFVTAVVLATIANLFRLIRGHREYTAEIIRRQQGCYRILLDNDNSLVSGTLMGIFGYMGLLMSIGFLSPSIDTAPNWFILSIAVSIMVGFFFFVRWSIRATKFLATSYLTLDNNGIVNTLNGKEVAKIYWAQDWKLKQLVHTDTNSGGVFLQEFTTYDLLLRLSQNNSEICIRFETVSGGQVGGLSEFSDMTEGQLVLDDAEWLIDKILEQKTNNGQQHTYKTLPLEAIVMDNLHFNKQDLEMYQQGICPSQINKKIDYSPGGITLGFALIALVFLAVSVNECWGSYSLATGETNKAILVVFFLFITMICFILGMSSFSEYRTGYKVMLVQGKLSKKYYKKTNEYWLRINMTSIYVLSETYQLFNIDQHYTFYYISPVFNQKILIAAESLKPQIKNESG